MPELEIHHESAHAIDATGQSVGVLAAVLAVLLAIVTIASHRTHTAAIIHKATPMTPGRTINPRASNITTWSWAKTCWR